MNGQMNPMQLIGLLKNRNPQEMVMSMIKNNNINDPTINELLKFAQTGDINSMNKIAENFFKGQGLDFNSEFNNFMSMLK